MKIIDHNTLQSVAINPLEAYQWVEDMLAKKKTAVLPPKISMRQDGNIFYNVMPCILPGENRMGVKIITRHPEKAHGPSLTSQILLYELSSGNLLAILDGSYITAIRTGAVAAHSTRLFANPDFHSIGMIGLGITATATMDILSAIVPNKKIEINLLRYKNQAEQFYERYRDNHNMKFNICDTPENVIRSSEVIISCVTYADKDFAEKEAYQSGCVVIPVHTRGFQNCDTFFDKVFVDDIGHVKDFKYFNHFKSLSEVSGVICGETAGRDNRQQRILVYNIGLAIHDIYFANKILNRLPQMEDYELRGPLKKMWF